MENFLYELHSGLRWLVVLATLIAAVWLLVGIVQKRAYDALAQRIMTAWSSLIGLQWIVGIVLFIVLGFDAPYRWEHAVTMTLALAAAHMHFPLRRRPDAQRYQLGLVIIIVTALLVYVGVARLPQGWFG